MRNDKPAKVPLLKDLKANRDLYLMMLPFFLLFFFYNRCQFRAACLQTFLLARQVLCL